VLRSVVACVAALVATSPLASSHSRHLPKLPCTTTTAAHQLPGGGPARAGGRGAGGSGAALRRLRPALLRAAQAWAVAPPAVLEARPGPTLATPCSTRATLVPEPGLPGPGAATTCEGAQGHVCGQERGGACMGSGGQGAGPCTGSAGVGEGADLTPVMAAVARAAHRLLAAVEHVAGS
jgi:hypothetical protein